MSAEKFRLQFLERDLAKLEKRVAWLEMQFANEAVRSLAAQPPKDDFQHHVGDMNPSQPPSDEQMS